MKKFGGGDIGPANNGDIGPEYAELGLILSHMFNTDQQSLTSCSDIPRAEREKESEREREHESENENMGELA